MTTSFYNGVSGLISFQSGIDIWGDNISNVNTPGFKESIPEFASIFSNTLNTNSSPTSDIGLGSYLNSTAKDLSTGSIIDSDNPFDIAIAGDGWIGVKNNENIFYTRNGSFTRDANGYLVNDNGEYLLVANANNIISQDGTFYIDPNINTSSLLPSNDFSSIMLPDSITFPPIPTQNVFLQTNLNNDTHLTQPTPATEDIDCSALYDKDANEINLSDGNNLVFGFGNKVEYTDGALKTTFCFADDTLDNQDVNIDFSLNSIQISLTLPDGSTKEEIANQIAKALQEKGFNATSFGNALTITTPKKLILTSNTPLLKNTAAAVLTYKGTPTEEFEFASLKDFENLLSSLASSAYNDDVTISFENGEIVFTNNTNQILNAYLQEANNSNPAFINNLGNLEQLPPNAQLKSFTFNSNSQTFSSQIIDQNGEKTEITFNFTKQKVTPQNQIWRGTITLPSGVIQEDFVFNTNGNLLSPTQISSSINLEFNLTAFSKASNTTNFIFEQDGVEKGYLTDYQIDEEGRILGLFSNSKQVTLAQIPVFHFQNPQGLESLGNSEFRQTDNSGEAFLYTQNGEYIPPKILSNKLENSNVNFTQAMTELIVTQKAFQASAKTVTTSDEMIQKAINLKR